MDMTYEPLAYISLLGKAEKDLTPDGKMTVADAVKMMKYDPTKHIVTYNGAITPPDKFNQVLQDSDMIVMVESKNSAGQQMLDKINAGVAARAVGQPDDEFEPLSTTGEEITFIWRFGEKEELKQAE